MGNVRPPFERPCAGYSGEGSYTAEINLWPPRARGQPKIGQACAVTRNEGRSSGGVDPPRARPDGPGIRRNTTGAHPSELKMNEPLARRGDPAAGHYCVETKVSINKLGAVSTRTCGPDPGAVQALDEHAFFRNVARFGAAALVGLFGGVVLLDAYRADVRAREALDTARTVLDARRAAERARATLARADEAVLTEHVRESIRARSRRS